VKAPITLTALIFSKLFKQLQDRLWESGETLGRSTKEKVMVRRMRSGEVEDRIRQDIVGGFFAFGQRLKINELAQRYGTSHMPIREALRLLSGEGLLDMEPSRGARVRTVDERFICNLFDVRIQIESLQARRAAEHRTSSQLADLHEARLEFERNARNIEIKALLASNFEFHHLVGVASGNLEASDIEQRHRRVLGAIWMAYGYPPERLPIIIDDHRLLEQLIADRDSDGAALLAASHCLRAKVHILHLGFGRGGPVRGGASSEDPKGE
jgi:DNA-binding GntR family transcriptional regulator